MLEEAPDVVREHFWADLVINSPLKAFAAIAGLSILLEPCCSTHVSHGSASGHSEMKESNTSLLHVEPFESPS